MSTPNTASNPTSLTRQYYCIFDGYNLTAYVHHISGYLVIECPKCKRRPMEITPWQLSERPERERLAIAARFGDTLAAQTEAMPPGDRWLVTPVIDALRPDAERDGGGDADAGDADADDEEEEAAAMAANQPPTPWGNMQPKPTLPQPLTPKTIDAMRQAIDKGIQRAQQRQQQRWSPYQP